MSSAQGPTDSMLQHPWNEGMVTPQPPVDPSVSQLLDAQPFLFTNTNSQDKVLPAKELQTIEDRNSVSPADKPGLTASKEPLRPLTTTSQSTLVPIQPAVASPNVNDRSSKSQEKVLSIEELRTIENIHSMTLADNTAFP